ncbi:MAG: DNA-directed RNA polymerase subunit H [Candidatus Jordarchaeum sp.]|uniref:DNA-directed RNA polymerase subunit H n=1 Tax=Candidatus Jordarchaeum sp. TaxID=2823881 RepID=UPI00404AF641
MSSEEKIIGFLKLRGYEVKEIEEKKEGNYRLIKAIKNGEETIFIIRSYDAQKVIGTALVRGLKEIMDEKGASKGFLVGGKRSTPKAREIATDSNIELIVDYPILNIFDHYLVPKHEIAEPQEYSKILEKYNIKKEDLPWIRVSDPAVKAIGVKAGDIIKIIRDSKTAGKTIIYRYVVDDSAQ